MKLATKDFYALNVWVKSIQQTKIIKQYQLYTQKILGQSAKNANLTQNKFIQF